MVADSIDLYLKRGNISGRNGCSRKLEIARNLLSAIQKNLASSDVPSDCV